MELGRIANDRSSWALCGTVLVVSIVGTVIRLCFGDGSDIKAVDGSPGGFLDGVYPYASAVTSDFDVQMVFQIISWCLFAGVTEELLFCCIVLYALGFLLRKLAECRAVRGTTPGSFLSGARNLDMVACTICAILFGIGHIGTGMDLAENFNVANAPYIIIVSLKMVQSASFGFCMFSLFLRTRNVLWPILAHFLFDFIYLGIPMVATGSVPNSLASVAIPTDTLQSLVVVMLLMLAAAVFAYRKVLPR